MKGKVLAAAMTSANENCGVVPLVLHPDAGLDGSTSTVPPDMQTTYGVVFLVLLLSDRVYGGS